MDNHIDLEALPSDTFDFDPEQPRSVADYSSWAADSSPPPADAQGEMEYSENEIEEDYEAQEEVDYSDPEIDESFEDHSDQDGQDDHEHEHDEHDEHEEDDQGIYGYPGLYQAEDEDEFEFVLEDELEEGDLEGEDYLGFDPDHQPAHISPAARQSFVDLIAEYQARENENRFSEAPSDSLFVDRGRNLSPPLEDLNLLPPLEDILSSVRRNHVRALNLVSELHSEVHNRGHSLRPFGQDRASRNSFGRGSVGPSRDNQRQNQRHHPYGMPQDRARERGRMPDQGRRRGSGLFRDELVELEMQPPRAPMRHNRTPARAQSEVIDLTGEPDTPDEPEVIVAPRARALNAGQIAGRNPRRQMSLNQRTPSLSRSDGSLLGNHANVIDLTLDDSPAPPPMPLQLPRRDIPELPHQNRHQRHHHRNRHAARAQPVNLDNQEGFGARIVAGLARRLDLFRHLGLGNQHDVEVQFIGGGLDMDNPLAGNAPDLNYRANGNNGPPKPAHVPPPAPRDGFTRDTGAADDVVVCPSCEQELKYDPDSANDDTMSGRAPKKPRTRKDQEEHYFWALKECGHVYCKDCYEGRKLSAKSSTARFEREARKVLCAVEDCKTDASNKLSWVGLFL